MNIFEGIELERTKVKTEIAQIFSGRTLSLEEKLTILFEKTENTSIRDKNFTYKWWKNFLLAEQTFNFFNAITCFEAGDLSGTLYQLRRAREGNAMALYIKKNKKNHRLVMDLQTAMQIGDEESKLDYLTQKNFETMKNGLIRDKRKFLSLPLGTQRYIVIQEIINKSKQKLPKDFNWSAHFNFDCHYLKTFSKKGKAFYSFAISVNERGIFKYSGTKKRYNEVIKILESEIELTIKRFNNF